MFVGSPGPFLLTVELVALCCSDSAIGSGSDFLQLDSALASFHTGSFSVGQGTRCNALLNSLFLVDLALVNVRCGQWVSGCKGCLGERRSAQRQCKYGDKMLDFHEVTFLNS